MKDKGEKFKSTVLATMLILILSFLLIFSYLIYTTQNSSFQDRISKFEFSSQKSVNYTINATVDYFYLISSAISEDKKVKALIRAKKREELYALLKSKWELWTELEPHFKTMLFHNPDGTAFLRMHKPDKHSDKLSHIRPMVKAIHNEQKLLIGYETGKYSTVYRIITPIFDNGEYIGSLDFGINPNHFADELYKLNGTKAVLFIKEDNLKLFKNESTFSINNYILQTKVTDKLNKLLSSLPKNFDFSKHEIIKIEDSYYSVYAHHMNDYKGNRKAVLLLFNDYTEVMDENHKFNIILFFISIVFFISMYYILHISFSNLLRFLKYINKKNANKFQKMHNATLFEEKFLSTILNTSNNIIISTIGKETLYSANKKFFELTGTKDINEFESKYECISDIFEYVDDCNYLVKDREGIHWVKYIYMNPMKTFKVKIKKANKDHIFLVSAEKMIFDHEDRNLFSFSDITEIVNYQHLLTQKDKLLFKQSKLASMGELISMIAHQWRQPLSTIATVAIKLDMDVHLEQYDEKVFSEKLNDIGTYVQHMSKTIDDFRDFYKPDKEEEEVILKDIISNAVSIIGASLKVNDINYILECETTNSIYAFKNELVQVILNLIKNAQDALIEYNVNNPEVRVTIKEQKKSQTISIADNGYGIKEEIIDKIFDPYFSTKDEKNGTGLGLYMSKLIIQDHCNGSIDFKNDNGAKFIITLYK